MAEKVWTPEEVKAEAIKMQDRESKVFLIRSDDPVFKSDDSFEMFLGLITMACRKTVVYHFKVKGENRELRITK